MLDLALLPTNAGVIICGHGSRAEIASEEFALLATALRARYPEIKIVYGFLEYSAPNIHMALDKLLEQGVDHIYAVPGMLFAATHAQNDIPSVLLTYQDKHPHLTIEYGKELGLHHNMIAAFEQRILEALGLTGIPETGALYDTMLVVVGRGTSVVEANADVAKLTRIIAENLGFGWSETVYSGVTFPSVGRGLEMAAKLGFKKVVVAPYFLFGGRLIDRIYAYVDKVAAEKPDIKYLKADYLRDQLQVIDTFLLRIHETINSKKIAKKSDNLMNAFKARLASGEVAVYHHHAEFKDEALPDDEHCLHSHSHSDLSEHNHVPYRHIGHPHGPRTMINENVCCCFMKQFPQEVIDEEQAASTARKEDMTGGVPHCKQ